MIRYVKENEFEPFFIIHEKDGKFKAYREDSELIKRYERFIDFYRKKNNKGKMQRSVQILFKQRHSN